MSSSARAGAAVRFAGRVALTALLAAAAGLALVFAVSGLLGFRAFVVESDSMSPALCAGDVVFAAEVDFEDLSVGDVVTYRKPGGQGMIVTHRVVSIDGAARAVTTRGDGNSENDPIPVPESALLGRLQFKIPLVGKFSLQ